MKHLFLLTIITLLISCNSKAGKESLLQDPTKFDTTIDNKKVQLYTLTNGKITAQFCNYGARIISLVVPDKDGNNKNVVWSNGSIQECLDDYYFYSGVMIGRYANRIGNCGKVTIDNIEYQLTQNFEDTIHAHGGEKGFSAVVWDAVQSINKNGEQNLTLNYFSPHLEEGYPGNMNVQVVYTITKDDALKVEYKATTDAPTIINLTVHPFFNLHGDKKISTNSHLVTVFADNYTPSKMNHILTGEIESVVGTPFDFLTPHTLGERVEQENEQIARCHVYDVNLLLNKKEIGEYAVAAKITEESTGINLEIATTQPALQIYGGPYQSTKSAAIFKEKGAPLQYGIALEAQNSPNAPHCPKFQNCYLNPGEIYQETTSYRFY